MSVGLRAFLWPALLSGGLFALVPAGLLYAGAAPGRSTRTVTRRARQSGPTEVDDKAPAKTDEAPEIPTIDLLEGLRTHQLSADGEGTGDGKMTVNVTNRTSHKLRVVLPPGLIAAGATGQFGGMGGMMGGMGGGMMGGMGGGFRSVPPTSLPEATLNPKQTRHLPTALVSLGRPDDGAAVAFPAKGEKLRFGDVDTLSQDSRINAALKQLAADKAPQTVSQLVMWNLAAGMDWATIERLSTRWANAHELTMAHRFVDQLDEARDTTAGKESGRIYVEVKAESGDAEELAGALRGLFEKYTILGLKTANGVPDQPNAPSLAIRIAIDDAKVVVHGAASDSHGTAWAALGTHTLKRAEYATGKTIDEKAAHVADGLAAALMDNLVRCTLSKGPRVKGKETYKIRIDNGSPLILNGLALMGPETDKDAMPTALAGLSLPPRKSLTVPVSADSVERLKLKEGVHVFAADLSGL